MSPAPDVAVIGGGIVGTAAAAFLAGEGARVTLYEREALAAGASGRNSGVIQQPFDPVLAPLYEESRELFRRLPAEVDWRVADFDGPPAGLLLVSRDIALVRAVAASLGATFPSLAPEVLEGAALRELEPALAPEVVACRLELSYPVVPSAPTYAFATLAERRGVQVRLGREARPVVEGGRCVGVDVAGRLEAAGAVLVAAGPWSAALVDSSGGWQPIQARWGVVVETLLAEPPHHVLEEAGMDEALGSGPAAGAARHGPGPEDGAEPAPTFSLITAAGASAVGSTFLADEPDPPAWTERLLEHAIGFVPSVIDAPIREVRACARPASIDGRPFVGPIPWADGLYIASGHGPWGISTGPASAAQIGEVILGRPNRIAPELSPGRVPPRQAGPI
ncbi:MAG: FAD-binding oxidoreductase [Chloroflexi bacterium]|nr:FAD-binding oxidoreductase [Chloroflexota bacterium]